MKKPVKPVFRAVRCSHRTGAAVDEQRTVCIFRPIIPIYGCDIHETCVESLQDYRRLPIEKQSVTCECCDNYVANQ